MPDTAQLFQGISSYWRPPPKWTVSQWADAKRQLSSESGPEPGRWRTARAEFQRGIMDALNDPSVSAVVCMKSSQVGWTEILNNIIGYYIDYDPCPMIMLQPTLDMAKIWSKDRLAPMLRDTPDIGRKISDAKGDSKNTVLHKSFRGGRLSIAGANSPASLASRPVRVGLCDEIDRYPVSAGKEGDPIGLVERRTENFWNRKMLFGGTPVWKGGRTDKAFELSDKRYFHIDCPRCGSEHTLKWSNVKWGKDTPAKGKALDAVFQCPHCDGYYSNAEKNRAVKSGQWIATAPFTGIAGFHIWAGYSPFRHIGEHAKRWCEIYKDPLQRQVFINTVLGECWEGGGEALDADALITRAEGTQEHGYSEEYKVPRRALALTAGIDTQPDRLEIEVVGWGAGEESWSIDHHVIYGDPDLPEGSKGSPWTDLTDYLRKSWSHESGIKMTISHSCIDAMGHNTEAVYKYCKAHKFDKIFSIKGQAGPGLPVVGPANRKRSGLKKKSNLQFIVGVDGAKATIMNRWRIEVPGDPGYCHFPKNRSVEWFKQITSEIMLTKHKGGVEYKEWTVKSGQRNEGLDCRVYAYAALKLASPDFGKTAFRIKQSAERVKPLTIERGQTKQPTAQAPEEEKPETAPKKPKAPASSRHGRRRSFVNSWR